MAREISFASLLRLVSRMRRSRRVRIVVSAVAIGVFFGVTTIGLPVDDVAMGARSALRRQPAPQNIIVVSLDDKTLVAFNSDDAPRSMDAALIRKLVSLGAERIFFSRTYEFAKEPAEDGKLVEALQDHRGKVYFGAIPGGSSGLDDPLSKLPNPLFRDKVGIVSLAGFQHPFKLSASFPFKSETIAGSAPGMAAKLANLDRLPDGIFRPNYSFDVKTIPTVSYINVIRGDVPQEMIAGRDVVVALSALPFRDYHEVPFQGYAPSAYFHVIAAHTLEGRIPRDLGWLPLFVPVVLIVIGGIGRGRNLGRYRISAIAGILTIVPFALDFYAIEVKIFPAAITAAVAILRGRVLNQIEKASETNVASGLPSFQSLRASSQPASGSLVALKIRNYSTIIGSFSEPIEAQLATEIVRRIRIGEPGAVIYHEGNTFLWNSSLGNAFQLAEHLEGLHRIVQSGIQIDGRDVDVSFNCGIDTEPGHSMPKRIAGVMRAVEFAVRNDEIVSQYEDGDETHWEVSLLSSLDRAIDNGDVWVAYQPKLDLVSERIVGAEALVRWTHPERGPISPEQFITIAEQHHRIERITRFVLNEAVRAAALIRRAGHDFSISVNISAQLLRNADLPDMIADTLASHDFPPDKLVLEITESDRFDRSLKSLEMMRRLIASGLQLSIDDFGTGNATIDYLRYLPAAEVKIDKTFVSAMDTNQDDFLLVQSIIEMAHSLQRRVVAEGVESRQNMEDLLRLSCDQVQGYYVSRPIRLEELQSFMSERSLKRIA